jgi:CRISPR type I-E-associated protein CasB/Cse2
MVNPGHAAVVFARLTADPGTLGEVRRTLRAGDASALLGPLGRLLPPEMSRWDERDWLDVAALVARVGAAPAPGDGVPIPRLAGKRGRELATRPGIERRFLAVVGAEREDLPTRLAALVDVLGDAAKLADWGALAADLGRWSLDGAPVQRRWAIAYRAAAGVAIDDQANLPDVD